MAKQLRQAQCFNYESMETLIQAMEKRTTSQGRAASMPQRKDGFSLVFGLYAHGQYFGVTRDTQCYPEVCKYE